jgi:ribosomal protein L7/L12
MRKNWLDFQKKLEAMKALEAKYNKVPVMKQVEALLREGKKIHALKLYKEETGKGLKEAKDDIDKLWVDLGLTGTKAFI